jgi:Transposase
VAGFAAPGGLAPRVPARGRRGCSQVVAHGGGRRRAGTAGGAGEGHRDAGGTPAGAALGWAVVPAAVGDRGLPAPVAAPGAGLAGRRGAGGPGAAQADGGVRRSARTLGKSDPIDALAVARAALREPELPVGCLDRGERQVRLLVDHREDLVAERTRAQQRLRWHLHELEPGWEIPAGGWTGGSGWTRSLPARAPIRGWWLRSLGSWWVAAAS